MTRLRVVAIDGPAGSGKSTIAKALAARLGLQHLDTGAMYRSVAWACTERGVSLHDSQAMARVAEEIDLFVGAQTNGGQVVTVDGVDVTALIRLPDIDVAVGAVASAAPVRAALVAQQRRWAQHHGGGVLEGRDIATVVFPDALVKVYLTASVDERARRRSAQHGGDVVEVAADIERRDLVDSTRAADPLQVAAGATVVDTTGHTIDEVLDQIELLVRRAEAETHADALAVATESTLIAPSTKLSSGVVHAAFPTPILKRRERALYGIVHAAVKLLLSTYIPTKYVGLENVPETGPFIVASVHRSVIDFMIVGLLTNRRLRYLGKDSVWEVKWFVPIADTLGGIPVSRGTIDRDSVNRCIEALTSGEPLVLFPEGRRKAGPVVEDLFDGVAFIALKAGVPILPVGIGGSDRVLPLGAKFPRRRRVLVKVGPVIESPFDSTTRTVRKAAPGLTDRLRAEIQRLYDEAQNEVR
jgi:cytidylate kinase